MPEVSISTSILYRVATHCRPDLQKAVTVLKRLNTKNKEFQETIHDMRLKSITRDIQKNFTGLSTEEVKVSIRRQEMQLQVRGNSLEALKVLRKVKTMMSQLPSRKARESRKQTSSHEGREMYKDTPGYEVGDRRSSFGSNGGSDGGVSMSMSGENTSFTFGTAGEPHQDKHTKEDMMKAENGKYGKKQDATDPHQHEGNYDSKRNRINNSNANDSRFPGVNEDVEEQASALPQNTLSTGLFEGQSFDDDSWEMLSMNEEGNGSINTKGSPKTDKVVDTACIEDALNEIHDEYDQASMDTRSTTTPDDTMGSAQKDKTPYEDSQNGLNITPESTSPCDAGVEEDVKVEWFFVDETETGRELQPYDTMNRKIEMAYLSGEKSVELPGTEEVYVIDFEKMEEFVKGCEDDRVCVVRREILPDHDVPLPDDLKGLSSNSKLIPVDRSSREFQEINEAFMKASESIKVTVVKIEKMLNVIVYKNYELKKDSIKKSGTLTAGRDHLERRLWHGPLTDTDTIINLSRFGFNRSYCSSGADQVREGVSFYPYIKDILPKSKTDNSGHHHVCFSKVLTGRTGQAHSGINLRKLSSSVHSLVDVQAMPSEFTVFFDNQALPEFLVTFSADS